MEKVSVTRVEQVPLVQIDRPADIDRMQIDQSGLEELAGSIEQVGLIQSILIRPVGERYEIVAGDRRYQAHLLMGAKNIRADIRDLSDKEAALIRATENLERENLTPLEEAQTYRRLYDKYDMSLEEIGERMKKSPGTIRRRMDICKMPPALQEALQSKRISITVAEELWPIKDPTSLEYYLSFAVENGCTKDVARGWAKDWKDANRRDEVVENLCAAVASPYEPRPIYIPCDLCEGPMELGKARQLRLCEACYQTVKQNI